MHSKPTLKVVTNNELPHYNEQPPTTTTPTTTTTTPPPTPPTPSIRLLFSLIPRHTFFILIIPAILSSMISGGIAPFMTLVVGQAFDAFARFPSSSPPSSASQSTLLHQVGISCLELIALAVGSIALGSLTSCLWIWVGETNAMNVRKVVYQSVVGRDMVWFDLHLGSGDQQVPDDSQGPLGAAGLMAKFARETDDVRMASSLASGMLIQYLTTCIACLILAFMRSWSLTLVILSAVPVLMVVQTLSQFLANPLLSAEREQTGISATIVDRAISAISTVKAFNATPYETSRATRSFNNLKAAAIKLNLVWGFTSGLSHFVMMAMFVQGFWYGAKLVRDNKVAAGDVMSVFWACLIATSNLQMCIPQFIVLAKGKFAMAALLEFVGDSQSSPSAQSIISPCRRNLSRKVHPLRKIIPSKCFGEFALHNVSFAYPSRPTLPVLQDVSLFLPANEMTFIVGSSGSGKSTIAQLLLRMYEPQGGVVTLDERDLKFLDEEWMRGHVAGVGQQGASGVVILDGKSLFDNVAIGARLIDEEPEKRDVEDACRAALMHEFVRDLPLGYDTILGGAAGVGLSGGQKQRLSIARARLCNPTVLILDEATSALDATSRILVFEALKRWRRNKTTIVITHDLSQIEPSDFVYVLKAGRVVEQGFRYDLESVFEEDDEYGRGEFRKMMDRQTETGGFLPEKDVASSVDIINVEDVLKNEEEEEEEEERSKEKYELPAHLKHQSIAIHPLTLGNWMFDAVADLTGSKPAAAADPPPLPPVPSTPFDKKKDRRLSIDLPSPTADSHHFDVDPPTTLPAAHPLRRLSLQFTPTSPVFSFDRQSTVVASEDGIDDEDGWKEKGAVQRSGNTARVGRENRRAAGVRFRSQDIALSTIKVEKPSAETTTNNNNNHASQPQFWSLMRLIYPTVPNKPVLFLGLLICLVSGSMTPIFSYLLSGLLFEVSSGAHHVSYINRLGGLVLGIAALDGLFLGLKFYVMEYCGMSWTTHIRSQAIHKILKQDKKWFDFRTSNSASDIVQVIVKDGDDARNLISVVWAQFLVVGAMLSVGLIWALARGWQLTLAGFAIAPVFAGVMALQTRLVVKCESRNKRAREDVARGYYDTIINIRGIRCMAFEGIFKSQFDSSVDKALNTGVKGAFVEGCTYGVASGLIYLAEALLFYVGAILIARGFYTYLQMVQVLNLVVFSVTIGSQLMAFTEKIAKSVQATRDLHAFTTLSLSTDESKGSTYPSLSGSISFSNVQFNYPSRPLPTPILKSISLNIAPGECVALVGSSGSGKSTIAALLQRLYEPLKGEIKIDGKDVKDVDVGWLREHVGVVSQQPNLFDASIAENIRYGSSSSSSESASGITDVAIQQAAKSANVHSFIMSLPQGYDTPVGENASLISGGQAQRLQIARALARPWTKILILDECTSSLDGENQAVVLDTIRGLCSGGSGERRGMTTLMVTHKTGVMKMCDRILVLDQGEIVEEGRYEQLLENKGGVFSRLANGGEWIGE